MMSELNIALCEGRHSIPGAVDGSIFGNTIANVTKTKQLEQAAFNGLWYAAHRHYCNGEAGFLYTDPDWDGADMEPLCIVRGLHVNLYVTGLTVALIAALNACRDNGVTVTLWHFDRESGEYYPQDVR